ncbi:hypothetical protein [Methylobacterium sp. Leaf466]|uniref:hypothetical protein n=1 Tax=Methylobacterium sp. Leaf466 TaxID=1736386 RepID=UPI0006F458DA|nr:hypothetical protein [Methylobacterium sp. Leaf466]KQT77733.1 hypothetical protein ASG59_10350 [Methylobacterium sp. Leaf466]
MLRSGALLLLAGPAAVIALFAQPLIRDGVDRAQAASLKTNRVAIGDAGTIRAPATVKVAAVVRSEGRRSVVPAANRTGTDKASSKPPRRLMKEGCEGAISSLAGPEARRMVPGRCIA